MAKMASVEIFEDLTDVQAEAQAGGEVLRTEVLITKIFWLI